MREIPIAQLTPIDALEGALLHRSSVVLRQPGESLSQRSIDLLAKRGVEKVYLSSPEERLQEVRLELLNQPMAVDELEAGSELDRPIYDDRGALLLEAGKAIPPHFAQSLQRRNISTIYLRRPESELDSDAGKALRKALADLEVDSKESLAPTKETGTLEDRLHGPRTQALRDMETEEALQEDFSPVQLARKIDRIRAIEVQPAGDPFEGEVEDTRDRPAASEEEKASYRSIIDDALNSLRLVFGGMTNRNPHVNVPAINEVVTNIMAGLIHNRDLMVLCGTLANAEDYLLRHALATAVVSINVGSSLGFGAAQIKSLAYGALLADVGLLKIAPDILNKQDKLTSREQTEIRRHPVLGLDMLQKTRGLPREVPYIVYQSHERANGSGYPCGKRDVVIHEFARIVGAADTYTAILSDRPYRRGQTAYHAMERLVFLTSQKLFNPRITRAFLRVHSLFPVGSFVYLSSGHVARVVAANPEDYMRPVVAAIWNAELEPLAGIKRLDLSGQEEVSIKQVISIKDLPHLEDLTIGF